MKINEHIEYWASLINEGVETRCDSCGENATVGSRKTVSESEKTPLVSSIGDFLDVCKKMGIEVDRRRVAKQGAVVDAHIAQEDETITSREGREKVVKGCLVVDDKDGTSYAVQPEDIGKYYEVDENGRSATGDEKKWKKIPKTLDYYITPFDVDIRVPWQDDPLHATAGYALVRNDREGKDISPVAPEVFGDRKLWKPIGETNESEGDTGLHDGEGYIDDFLNAVNRSEDNYAIDLLLMFMNEQSIGALLDYVGKHQDVVKMDGVRELTRYLRYRKQSLKNTDARVHGELHGKFPHSFDHPDRLGAEEVDNYPKRKHPIHGPKTTLPSESEDCDQLEQ